MSHDQNHDNESKVSRRKFISLAAAGLLTGAAAVVTSGPFRKGLENYLNESFGEKVEVEKASVIAVIEQSLKNQGKFSEILKIHNRLVEESQKYNTDTNDYQRLQNEAKSLNLHWPGYWLKRGNLRIGLLSEANEYSEELLNNSVAVENLAVARVIYREGVRGFEDKEFRYLHNCAFAYLELGKQSQEEIKQKMVALFKYVKGKNLRISDIPQEQVIYALGDGGFDFSLTPEKIEELLKNYAPNWRDKEATHSDKASYLHYNDLSTLTVFELNRLKSVLVSFSDPSFVSSIFKTRDLDLKDPSTEYGGVIPKPGTSEGLEVIPGEKEGGNNAYIVPDKTIIKLFGSAAEFHFHANRVDESSDKWGPSGGDYAFFGPGVVFSSVNLDTIVAHFYAGRESVNIGQKREFKKVVVALGIIKKG